MADEKIDFDSSLDSDDYGNYGNGPNSILEEWTFDADDNEFITTLLTEGDFTTVRGDEFSEYSTSGEDINPFINYDKTRAMILGLPSHFNRLDDPNGRMFKEHIIKNLPIVFVIPGTTRLNSKIIRDNGSKVGKGGLFSLLDGSSLDITKLAVKGARTGNDLRFLGFKPRYDKWYEYVQTLAESVHATLGLDGIFNFRKDAGDFGGGKFWKNYGLAFYADKSTSISEDASNDYTQSSIAQQANDAAAQTREMKTLLGMDESSNSLIGKALNFVTDITANLAEGLMSLTGIFSRAGNIFGRVVNGSQLLFPEMWADSKFNRSYTLSFKWYSLYADPESIFNKCYVPFISWLCLSLPIEDSLMGYSQPFALKIISPGYFESSFCAVQSISFVRGGDDQLWTIDNLPMEITADRKSVV